MTTNTKQPHKHAAIIKAWADGEEIEWRRSPAENWQPVTSTYWYAEHEYRVKPANTVRYCPAYITPAGGVVVGVGVSEHSHAIRSFHPDRGPYETLKGVLRIEINPYTFELVSATMEKP